MGSGVDTGLTGREKDSERDPHVPETGEGGGQALAASAQPRPAEKGHCGRVWVRVTWEGR